MPLINMNYRVTHSRGLVFKTALDMCFQVVTKMPGFQMISIKFLFEYGWKLVRKLWTRTTRSLLTLSFLRCSTKMISSKLYFYKYIPGLFPSKVEQHLHGLIGIANHLDMQKICTTGLFFENRLQ